jgi:hypothetical protein
LPRADAATDTVRVKYLVAVALVAGCYDPRPPAGAPCANGVCPTGLVCSPATMTCEYAATDARPRDTPVDAPVDTIDADLSLYRYRQRITITTGAALPAGFTIRVPLASLATLVAEGKVKADFSDLRVIGDGTLGERDRIIDPPGGLAPVAVNFSLMLAVPAGTSMDYALYYGSSSPGVAPANGSAVFPVYDDFTSGIASFWIQNDGPITSGGKLVLRAGHADALTTNAASDKLPIVSAVELVANVIDPTSASTVQATGSFWYWFGYQRTGDFTETDPWIIWIARGKSTIHGEQKSPVGCEAECDGPQVAQDTASHYYVIERDPSATRFYLDNNLSYTDSDSNTADYSVMVRNFMATSDLDFDWVRARPRTSPDPTITLGAEETL